LGLALLLVVALCDAGLRWQHSANEEVSAQAVLPARATNTQQAPACTQLRVVNEGLIPMPEGVPVAHASNLVAISQGHPWYGQKLLAAFWFAGTRESAADVQIAMSTFDRQQNRWDAPHWVVNRQVLGDALGIKVRRLGNPVAWSDAQGRFHLFVVATGLGGWAASRVVHLIQDTAKSNDVQASQFKVIRTLPLTALVPAFNTSTLVRAAPLPLADGGAVLPLYFEIGIKYGVALRLNAQGEMQGLTRITQRRDVLQPTLIAHTPLHWSALMRDYGPTERIAHSETHDGGQTWHDQSNLNISNPDTSVAVLQASNGAMLMAHNTTDRRREVLYMSTNSESSATNWHTQAWVKGINNEAGNEFSYPSLIEVPRIFGDKKASPDTAPDTPPDLWLSYTNKRQAIAFQRLQLVCKSGRGGAL
jgi:predicted neuraminidase